MRRVDQPAVLPCVRARGAHRAYQKPAGGRQSGPLVRGGGRADLGSRPRCSPRAWTRTGCAACSACFCSTSAQKSCFPAGRMQRTSRGINRRKKGNGEHRSLCFDLVVVCAGWQLTSCPAACSTGPWYSSGGRNRTQAARRYRPTPRSRHWPRLRHAPVPTAGSSPARHRTGPR